MRAVIACLLLLLGAGCVANTEDEVDFAEGELGVQGSSNTPPPSNPTSPSDTLHYLPNRCANGAVLFDGLCRSTTYFERFLSEGAALVGVGGPPASDSNDTGAVVLEALSENAYNLLYFLPTRVPSGQPLRGDRQYRGGYPLVFVQAVVTWQDNQNFLHVFSEGIGPKGGRFTTTGWTHYARTQSGYEMEDSTGRRTIAQASSNGGPDYCGLAAVGAGWVSSAVCLGAATVAGAALGVATGIATGVAVFAMGTSSTFGLGGPEAAIAGIGAGATVGAAVFGASVSAGAAICGGLGALVTKGVDTLVCSGTPQPTDEVDFIPMLPMTPVSVDPLTGLCPNGMISYTGLVTKCESTNTIINDPDHGEIESVDVTCTAVWVTNKCVFP